MIGAFLEELTWADAAARFRRDAVVVVPIGAAAKEHGHHLPLNTDWLTARELGRRIAERLPVVVAPVIGFGFYPAFAAYPGSQHLSAATFQALVAELLGNLIDQGARRIVVVNTGVSTEPPLRLVAHDILARRGVRVAVADMRLLGRDADAVLEQKSGGHADERETSVMLAIAPEAVRMDRARKVESEGAPAPPGFARPVRLSPGPLAESELNESGATGDPSLATREKGERILAAMTRDLVDGIRALYPDIAAATGD